MNQRSLWPLLVLLGASPFVLLPAADAQTAPQVEQAVRDQLTQRGRTRVMLQLNTSPAVYEEEYLSRRQLRRQRNAIVEWRERVRAVLDGTGSSVVREFDTVPFVAVDLDADGLAALESAGADVTRVIEDRLLKPALAESVPRVEADQAWEIGIDGTGQVIAVIDSGVDASHPFLAGKVLEEACYSSGEGANPGDCPNGQATQTGPGAGAPCTFDPFACAHGTHVAGIAAGSGAPFSGVARGATLFAIQVFHGSTDCSFFETNPCARAFASDMAAALERVYELRDQLPIAAVNLSLGGGLYDAACDVEDPQITMVIDNLRAAGIATVAAAGNDGSTVGILFPSCISSAVSVGASTDLDDVAWFSNASADLDLLAPGQAINSSIPGGDFTVFDGTSMATPHVAGAWAILRQANPAATVDEVLSLLSSTGRPITDTRSGLPLVRPRIRIGAALGIEAPAPTVTAISPSSIPAWGSGVTVTVTGTDFGFASVVQIDGGARPTVFVDETTLTAQLSAADIATTAPSLEISVYTPPPGGGTSVALPLAIRQPALSTDTALAPAGTPVTATLVDGPGGNGELLVLARVTDPDTEFSNFVYVPAGASTFNWAATPSTPGDYEFRLFLAGTYTRLATSPVVTVTAAPEPDPPSLSVSMGTAAAGDPVTVTLTDGPGGVGELLALAKVSDPASTFSDYTFVPSGASTYSWTLDMPAAAGDYEFRLLATDFSLLATSPTVTVGAGPDPDPASLTVSATEVAPGDSVTVSLADGPGGSSDWMTLAKVGDPASSLIDYVFLPGGATTFDWTVTMPTAPGQYEFRLLENGTYNIVATSAPVTVATPPDPGPETLTVSTASALVGDAVTVTLTNGPGGNGEWLALARVTDLDTSFVDWVYVASGATTFDWTATMPAEGAYEFRLFLAGSYTRIATSETVTVGAAPPAADPVLTVSATSAAPGDAVTVTLSDGPGGVGELLAFAKVTDPDSTFSQYTFVPSGATTFDWTVTMPAEGDYEFRLLATDFSRLAASPTVNVVLPPPSGTATLTPSVTEVAPGGAVTVSLTDGPGGSSDWMTLAKVGDPASSLINYTFLPAGASSFDWTVNMPTTPGEYEFRLLENGTYTIVATSVPVIVAAPPDPGPETLIVSTTSALTSEPVTVTLTNGPGGVGEFLALAKVSDPDSSFVTYTYVDSGATTFTWTVNMPGTPGDYEFRLLQGAYERLATSEAVTVTAPAAPVPTLSASTTAAAPGEAVTMTLTNGPGGNGEWVSLAKVSDPATDFITYSYVDWGATTFNWTVNMPSTPGDYEFRLYLIGYNIETTSPTITVAP
jgi:subtilisin family serine protease